MKTFTTLREFEEHYFPDEVEKYPVVFRHRVTHEEYQLLEDWIIRRHCQQEEYDRVNDI